MTDPARQSDTSHGHDAGVAASLVAQVEGTHAEASHAAGPHAAGNYAGAGHGGHEQPEPLGPIDWAAWAAGVVGVAAGLLVAGALMVSVSWL